MRQYLSTQFEMITKLELLEYLTQYNLTKVGKESILPPPAKWKSRDKKLHVN